MASIRTKKYTTKAGEKIQIVISGKGSELLTADDRKGLSFATQAEADQRVVELHALIESRIAGNAEPVAAKVHTMASLAYEYLEAVRFKKDEETGEIVQKRGFKGICDKVMPITRRFIGQMDINLIDAKVLQQYKDERSNDKKSDGKKIKQCSVRKDLEYIRRFLEWANGTYGTKADLSIYKTIPGALEQFLPKEAKNRDKVFTESEYKKLCAWAAKRRTWLEPIIMLAYETSMRRSEILAIRPEYVNFEQRFIDMPGEFCKKGIARKVPLSQTALILLEALCEGKPKDQPLFHISRNTVTTTFTLARKETGIATGVLHSMRHTAISRYSKAPNMNMFILATISGHKDPATLQTYFHGDSEYVASLMG